MSSAPAVGVYVNLNSSWCKGARQAHCTLGGQVDILSTWTEAILSSEKSCEPYSIRCQQSTPADRKGCIGRVSPMILWQLHTGSRLWFGFWTTNEKPPGGVVLVGTITVDFSKLEPSQSTFQDEWFLLIPCLWNWESNRRRQTSVISLFSNQDTKNYILKICHMCHLNMRSVILEHIGR